MDKKKKEVKLGFSEEQYEHLVELYRCLCGHLRDVWDETEAIRHVKKDVRHVAEDMKEEVEKEALEKLREHRDGQLQRVCDRVRQIALCLGNGDTRPGGEDGFVPFTGEFNPHIVDAHTIKGPYPLAYPLEELDHWKS